MRIIQTRGNGSERSADKHTHTHLLYITLLCIHSKYANQSVSHNVLFFSVKINVNCSLKSWEEIIAHYRWRRQLLFDRTDIEICIVPSFLCWWSLFRSRSDVSGFFLLSSQRTLISVCLCSSQGIQFTFPVTISGDWLWFEPVWHTSVSKRWEYRPLVVNHHVNGILSESRVGLNQVSGNKDRTQSAGWRTEFENVFVLCPV